MADQIPSATQELERKTLDLMENLVWKTEAGRVSQHDCQSVATAVWTLTAGLVSNSISSLCAQAANVEKTEVVIKRLFMGKGYLVTVEWPSEKDGYKITRQSHFGEHQGETKVLRESDATLFGRINQIRSFCDSLLAANYTEIPPFQN